MPSGLLWANCNLGANAPEEYGDYYAWGETQTKANFRWRTYCYCTVYENGYLRTLTKYNYDTTYGDLDNLTVLEAMDDAATAKLGDGARTPTKEEWEELLANTTVEWTTLNGVNGRKYTGSNGNTIFLPAAGYFYAEDLRDTGTSAFYWSSTLGTDTPANAWGFYFTLVNQGTDNYNSRSFGQSVRPVRSAQ